MLGGFIQDMAARYRGEDPDNIHNNSDLSPEFSNTVWKNLGEGFVKLSSFVKLIGSLVDRLLFLMESHDGVEAMFQTLQDFRTCDSLTLELICSRPNLDRGNDTSY